MRLYTCVEEWSSVGVVARVCHSQQPGVLFKHASLPHLFLPALPDAISFLPAVR